MFRWKREGGIPLDAADRTAVSLGMHPVEVWPDWYELDAVAYSGWLGEAMAALAGAAVDLSRRSVPRSIWRLGIAWLERLVDVAALIDNALAAASDALSTELERLRIEAGTTPSAPA